MALTHSPSIVRDGLVLHLDSANVKSYPGSGTVWTDLSGNGNNSILKNGPTLNFEYNGSMHFDGVDDYSIIETFNSSYLLSGSTFSVWVKMDELPMANPRFFQYSLNADNVWNFACYGGNDPENKSWFWFERNKNGTRYASTTSGAVQYEPNVWYNVVSTFDENTNEAKIYINSKRIIRSGGVGGAGAPTAGDMYISSTYFTGLIPIGMMYNRALSEQEIQQNFEALRGRYGI